jgi:pimeloyl-ACP methyl ester carboxylesterase
MPMSMPSHASIAKAVAAAYAQAPTVFAGDNVRAVWSDLGDSLLIAVPGTTDVAGWLRDFRWWPAYFHPLGWCHRGFGLGAKALWADVRPRLPPARPVIYAGHSLGGAMALLLAAYHRADPSVINPCRLVTFGAPRVPLAINMAIPSLLAGLTESAGVDDLGRPQRARAVAYERDGDPIPHMPPRPLFKRGMRGTPIGTRLAEIYLPMENHAIQLYIGDLLASGR